MKRILVVTAAIAGLLSSLPAVAQFQKPQAAVEYRQAVMTVMSHHVGLIGAMAMGKVPFDAAAVAANADVVALMSKQPYVAFVKGTSTDDIIESKAKPGIWTDRAKFDDEAKTMQDAVLKLVAAAKTHDAGQVKTAFGTVAKACKACHDDFRSE
jgi:cytochrome c556